MNLRHYLLSSVCRSPDEPTAEPEVTEALAEPAALAEPEVIAEPEPAPAPEPKRAPQMVPLRVLQERVGEESTKRAAEARRAEAAETRAANAEALLQRMQNSGEEPGKPAPQPRAEQPQNFDRAVAERAEQLVFEDTKGGLVQKGYSEFGKPAFDDACSVVVACGYPPDDLVRDLLAVDGSNASKLIMELSKDGERAARLAGMNSRQRISELTRMAMTAATTAEPAPKVEPKPAPAAEVVAKPAVSRAPSPKPAVAPHAAAPEVDPTTPEGNDKMDDKQWEAWYKNKYMKRA